MLINISFCETFRLLNHFFMPDWWSCCLSFRDQRQADDEGGSSSCLAFKGDSASVLLDHDGMGNSQPLTRAFSNLLGRKERVEDASPRILRYARARVADANFRPVAFPPRAYLNG